MTQFNLKAFNASPVARYCKAREVGNTYFRNWSSMSAVAELAARREDPDVMKWCNENSAPMSSMKSPDDDWDFGAGLDGAAEIFRKGWSEGAQRLKDVIINAPDLAGRDFAHCYDVAGIEPDIDRFIAGEPEYMIDDRPKDAHESQTVIRLFIPFNASCGWSAEQFANRGAAILSIINALEQSGYAIELLTGVVNGMAERGKTLIDLIPVKQADQHFDIERIASALAHPAFFRRLWFTAIECDPRTIATGRAGYGSNFGYTPEKFQEMTKGIHELEGVTLIAGALKNSQFNSLDQALTTLKINNPQLAEMMGE